MKALNLLLLSFAILVFSGCYTQLLLEDEPSSSGPVYIPPPSPPIWPYDPWNPDPGPTYVPPPDNGNSNPGGGNQNNDTQRKSGYERRGNPDDQNARNDQRSSGPSRNGDNTGTQNTTQTNASSNVPTRVNQGTPSTPSQSGSQASPNPNPRGRR